MQGANGGWSAPDTDHSVESAEGHYMYLESTNSTLDATAVLEGPWVTTNAPDCTMMFYYHLNGTGILKCIYGTLKLHSITFSYLR